MLLVFFNYYRITLGRSTSGFMVSLALSTPHNPEAGLRQKLLEPMNLGYSVLIRLSLDLATHPEGTGQGTDKVESSSHREFVG